MTSGSIASQSPHSWSPGRKSVVTSTPAATACSASRELAAISRSSSVPQPR